MSKGRQIAVPRDVARGRHCRFAPAEGFGLAYRSRLLSLTPTRGCRQRRRPDRGEGMAIPLSLNVNGKPVATEVDPRMLLVQLLREQLRLTGTHVGCDTGQCGACTVHLDGRAVKSCTLLALQAQGSEVTTIEGIAAADGSLHPMQAAFKEHHGLQCGFCTPGMVMNAIDLVRARAEISE